MMINAWKFLDNGEDLQLLLKTLQLEKFLSVYYGCDGTYRVSLQFGSHCNLFCFFGLRDTW